MTTDPYEVAAYWRRHYQSFATIHDPRVADGRTSYEDEDLDALARDAMTALDLRHSDVLLDIGAGRGLLSERLVSEAAALVRVDFMREVMPTVVGDAIALPFRDRSFDKVLLSGVLLCVPHQWHGAVLREMQRVTRLVGRAFVAANPFVKTHEMAHVFDPEALKRLALGCGWRYAYVTPTNPRLDQANYYFDMVLIK